MGPRGSGGSLRVANGQARGDGSRQDMRRAPPPPGAAHHLEPRPGRERARPQHHTEHARREVFPWGHIRSPHPLATPPAPAREATHLPAPPAATTPRHPQVPTPPSPKPGRRGPGRTCHPRAPRPPRPPPPRPRQRRRRPQARSHPQSQPRLRPTAKTALPLARQPPFHAPLLRTANAGPPRTSRPPGLPDGRIYELIRPSSRSSRFVTQLAAGFTGAARPTPGRGSSFAVRASRLMAHASGPRVRGPLGHAQADGQRRLPVATPRIWIEAVLELVALSVAMTSTT